VYRLTPSAGRTTCKMASGTFEHGEAARALLDAAEPAVSVPQTRLAVRAMTSQRLTPLVAGRRRWMARMGPPDLLELWALSPMTRDRLANDAGT